MKSYSAYTLIELLIGMTIISTVFLIGVAGFRDFSRRQALEGQSKKVISSLRTIQQKALSGEKPESCDRLNSYRFDIVPPSTYSLYAICSTPILINGGADLSSLGITISANIEPIEFKVLGQGTNLSQTSNITLTSTIISKSIIVSIGTGGEIK